MAQACLLPFCVLFVLFGSEDLVVTMNGQETVLGEVRLSLLGILVLWTAFAYFFGFGLWKGQRLQRHAFVGLNGAAGLLCTIMYPSPIVVLEILLALALLAWYLYGKKNVREFFGDT